MGSAIAAAASGLLTTPHSKKRVQPHPRRHRPSLPRPAHTGRAHRRHQRRAGRHRTQAPRPARPLGHRLHGDRVINRIPGHERGQQHPARRPPVGHHAIVCHKPRLCRPPARTSRNDTLRNEDQLTLSGIRPGPWASARSPTAGHSDPVPRSCLKLVRW